MGETTVFQHQAVATSSSLLSCNNFTCIPLSTVFNSSSQNIPFLICPCSHNHYKKSSCLISFLLHASFPPAVSCAALHVLPFHSLIPPPSLLLQSPSMEALSLTNYSNFPHLKHSFWHRAALLRLLLSNWSDGKHHVSVSQPTNSWRECSTAKHPGFISEDYKVIM